MIHNWSIEKKLGLITFFTSTTALVLSTVGFLIFDTISVTRTTRWNLTTEAEVLGITSTAALTFGDNTAGDEILNALKARPAVVRAALYDVEGNLFATYPGPEDIPARLPVPGPWSESSLKGGFIRTYQPISFDGRQIGTIFVQSNTAEIEQRLQTYLLIVSVLMLFSGWVAFLLSSSLRVMITGPILHLERTMQQVTRSRDYSLRVQKQYSDEVGTLIDGFNTMIGEIDDAQTELRALNDNLEERVAERSESLREAKELAEQANRTKSAFLANMSHELRTPLNAILGYSEMLVEECEDADNPEYLEELNRINKAGKHLLSIINNVLDLSKIEAGRVELTIEAFDFREVIDDVVGTVEQIARKHSNQLVVVAPDSLPVESDQTKARQVLLNLLSNACKFTDAGTITISAKSDSGSGHGWLEVNVEDTGIGIDPHQADRLFEPFVQADASTTRKYGGTGLGLAISRRYCRLVGGDLTVESVPGVGSTFSMRVPSRAVVEETVGGRQPVPTEATAPAPREPGTLSVVVIDDDADARELLSWLLIRQGLVPVVCSSAGEGLEAIQQHGPVAITLDVQMDGIDGWTLLERLKKDPEIADIPVIMVTVVDEPQRGLDLGAFDYLTKPLNAAAFQRSVQRCVKGTGAALPLPGPRKVRYA